MALDNDNINLKTFLDKCDNNTLQDFLIKMDVNILSLSKKEMVKCLTIKDFFYNTIKEEDIIKFMTKYYLFEKEKLNNLKKECKATIDKHEALTKYGNAVFFMIDPSTMQFTFSKGKGLKTLGLQEDEVVGKNVNDYYQDNTLIMNGIQQAATGKERHGLLSIGDIHFDVNFTPVFNDDGKVIEVVGMAFDISNHIQLEEKLKEANIAKDKFFSIIAHDLKGPFGSVVSFLDHIITHLKEYEYDELQLHLGLIEKAATRSYNQLIKLLERSRSQSTIAIKLEYFNLQCDTLEQVMQLNTMAKAKNIIIENTISESINIYADKNMFNTIIGNLISNAIKFTGGIGKDGKITLSAEDTESKIILSVKDTGIGMTEDKKESLFKIDQISSTQGTNNETGTGLGLSLCKDFVDKHHGEIWVDQTELGKGTTIKFSIPKIEPSNTQEL